MAILSKIRERSMALILVIGLALFAFVLDPSSIQDFFNSTKINTVGEVNGESISRTEFSQALEAYKTQVGNRVTEMQASNAVWNNLLRTKIYQSQLAEAGITVGESDVWNALIENPSVRSNVDFQNEAGLFDQEKLKAFLAAAKDNTDDQQTWIAWTNFMAQLKSGLETSTYNNLISAGLGASLKEGELQYKNENTKINSQVVFVPFTSVTDSIIKVNKSEIEAYVSSHASQFEVEESRDIKIVKFDITPTAADEDVIKKEVAELLTDTDNSKGLRNTTDITGFFSDNDSDLPLDTNYNFKGTVTASIADAVFKGKKGDVFGPYKDKGYFKISKITEVTKISDSAKGAHILIPYVGSEYVNATKTEAQAKKSADSIYKLVRRNKKKFTEIADEINPDGTKGKGGDTEWLTKNTAYSIAVPLADYLFFQKKGSIGVIKSKFGYHVVRVDDQTKKQAAVKLATYARKIDASQETENTTFQNAESFALELSKDGDFDEVVKQSGYTSQPGLGLKVLDENVPGVGNQRNIVTWAFNSENKVGDFKRFDTNQGHVVVVITNKTEKGLMSAAKAASVVRPILANKKKAVIIKEKMNGATLNDIAKANNVSILNANDVTLSSPIVSGVGYEPVLVGAMSSSKENVLQTNIVGTKGVFAFVVVKREAPLKLDNYDSFRKRIEGQRKTQTNNFYTAIKKAAKVEDFRSSFYGIK